MLHQDGEEEEDLGTADGLADAASLAHAEDQHLLALHLVQLGAVVGQEALRHEGGRVLPHLTDKSHGRRW